MRNIYALLLVLFSTGIYAQQRNFNISDLVLQHYQQEVLQPQSNLSLTGNKMRIAGQIFDKGLSVHAPFTANLYAGKKALRLKGWLGIDDRSNRILKQDKLDSLTKTDGLKTFFYTADKTGKRTLYGVGSTKAIAPGSIELSIYGDGKKIWTSGIIRQGEKAREINLPVTGIAVLSFSVTDGGDGISGDVADLASLEIETTNPEMLKFVPKDYSPLDTQRTIEFSLKLLTQVKQLPTYVPTVANSDWLIEKPKIKAAISKKGNGQLVMSNGLVSRTICIAPNAASISLKNLVTEEEFIRAVQPEAIVDIDGTAYKIGGLSGQVNQGYFLASWLSNMTGISGSFQLNDIEIKDIQPRLQWQTKRWVSATQWQAAGKELILRFIHPDKAGVIVEVHHQIYDGIPLLAKSIVLINNSKKSVVLDHFTSEIIAFPEAQNAVSDPAVWVKPNFYIENEYAFGGMVYDETVQSIAWEKDKTYTSQVNYELNTPCIVKSSPKIGPAQTIEPGKNWQSFNTYVLPLDGTDKERNSLSKRKMYRLLAPWITENPMFLHLTTTNPDEVKAAIDQCKETGYEMVILSFGSGLNMEDTTQKNLDKFKQLVQYAHAKGIQLGGYSLFSSRKIGPETDVIDIKTGKPGGATFGNAPCMGSTWGIEYLKKLKRFYEYTGFDLLEHDGPYPGDFCASKDHPGHVGYEDSQWTQWKQSTELYQWLLKRDVYINAPDFYILSGSTKTGLGYREVNWSLPRAEQIVLGRQNIYDGTWQRTPSMGWTFVPLVEYQGGGKEATLEPLSEHLDAYQAHMRQNYGSGVQACYRGKRLYDTDVNQKNGNRRAGAL